MAQQTTLHFNPVKNFGLLSSHWIENRLRLEAEWDELEEQARQALDELGRLWATQRTRVDQYGNEAGLEHAFIQPVLETLGWKPIYQTFLQGRKPDYALFLDDAALDRSLAAGRNEPAFWSHPAVVADAKAWHISLDRPTVVGNKREYPPEQIEWYLDRSQLNYGILTNGKLWRLIPRQYTPQQRRFQTYLECDLPALLEAWRAKSILIDDFKEFFLFFGPVAFVERDGRKPLIVRAIEGSSEYRLGVGESLKQRAFKALELCIEGFLSFQPNGLRPADDLAQCREHSFVLLYRLLFIMFAEDRRLLPYRINHTYTNNRSMGRHRDEVARRLDLATNQPTADYARDTTDLWADLQDLFDLVDRGHRSYGVPAYNGGLFDQEHHAFLANKRVPDYYLARIIDQLGRAPDPEHLETGLFRVDYRDLAIQHLGSIYEGLLELHPHHASERMVVVSRRVQNRVEEQILPATARVPAGFELTDISYRPGTVYLQTNKGERRASGSYYTPDHIVEYIVLHTIGPLLRNIDADLERDLAEAEETRVPALRREFDDRVLRLRILDPAMGSGHFLIRACQYVAEEIATHPYSSDDALAQAQDEESALSFWKRRVAECCLYGVDLNGLAVELAKLALWLETVAINRPLTFLDHHLRPGNSLIGARLVELGALPQEIELRASAVSQQVEEQLPVLLKPLSEIRQTPSESVEQIKSKQRLYKTYDNRREPFRLVADLWASSFAATTLTDDEYQQAIEAVAQPRKFTELAREPWFTEAIARARRPDFEPFHWELEFLEAFYGDHGRRPDAGFDAVIGNPPYEVLSELESGRDLAALRAFINHERVYGPSISGKNNLYKLFICRSLELLAEGGQLGFITPMAILGDKITCELRKQITAVASFTNIEAFPQKDRPAERVFPEAKLSTAVFTLQKSGDQQPFRARVHPGRYIIPDSPSYSLQTDQIPRYDPVNFTIVSCSQADWDLAVRIMQTGRLARLSEFAEFFQGEVNETNSRRDGHLVADPDRGQLVTRGASICLYVGRPASQGEDLYLNVARFLAGKAEDSKAFHHRYRRVCWQESSPQNNFRRIIAALVNEGRFCNHKINYLPEHTSKLPLEFVLGLLNSKLADWYFRLGSTNAAVSHYQVYNLPCPRFEEEPSESSECEAVRRLVRSRKLDEAFQKLSVAEAPFNRTVLHAIVEAVQQIISIEHARGDIRRVDRSALDPHAQPFQDFIDRLVYATAGITDEEARGLESRLADMI